MADCPVSGCEDCVPIAQPYFGKNSPLQLAASDCGCNKTTTAKMVPKSGHCGSDSSGDCSTGSIFDALNSLLTALGLPVFRITPAAKSGCG